MKKTLIVLMMVLLSAMLIVSCNNNPEQKKTVKVGDVIELGTYPAEAEESYVGKPITWKVLKIDGSKALVISEKILTKKSHGAVAWADSEINKWLNNTGSDGFIAQYGLGDVSMAQVGDVNGKVFLLNKDEAGTYFADKASRIAYDLSGEAVDWFLSTPYSDENNYYYCVFDTGTIDNVSSVYSNGVRPAFWTNL
jgi:hypothetical protein